MLLKFDKTYSGYSKNYKIVISSWLMINFIVIPKRKKTGCAAALGTEFVWKEIKISKKKNWFLKYMLPGFYG